MSLARITEIIESLYAAANGTTTKRLQVVLCGTQAGGTITPVLVDSTGKLITTAAT
jgi:hypothetical protein